MTSNSLYDLIWALQYGNNLHIGVFFLGNTGTEKTRLPRKHSTHTSPVCEVLKSDPQRQHRCLRCRNLAIRRAARKQKAFGDLCINGIYEYTHPVVLDGRTVCIIYVGNILTESGKQKLAEKVPELDLPLSTMESDFSLEDCQRVCGLVESYIRALLKETVEEDTSFNPLILNLKNYIHANLEYDISMGTLADLFHYNEVYLGRLFKKETGMTLKEYINQSRVGRASKLLRSGEKIIAVAHKVGFNNVTYFNRVFKQHMGKTPSEYRAEK